MHKILLILKREYLSRVRKKSFIVMTLLGPFFFVALWAVPFWLTTQDGNEKIIEVLDESGLFEEKFSSGNSIKFSYIKEDLNDAKKRIPHGENYGLLYIPELDLNNPTGITFFSEKSPSMEVVFSIEKTLKNEIEDLKLSTSGIDKELLAGIKTRVSINTINLSAEGEKESNSGVASVIGYIAGFLIYMFIFINGAQVMRGIIEEKSSRIVEVIISSVKPFQLMMGKIFGIAAVSLTQFGLWIILTVSITTAISAYFGINRFDHTQAQIQEVIGNSPEDLGELQASIEESAGIAMIFKALDTVNLPLVLGAFLFYFLGGYLLYGALFAAVGSAVESDADSQQFMLPISIPLIISIISLAGVIKDPDGPIAFWMSMIPLTSPVVMLTRIPFGVPG